MSLTLQHEETPSKVSGSGRVYTKANDLLYYLNSQGVETQVAVGSSIDSFGGATNGVMYKTGVKTSSTFGNWNGTRFQVNAIDTTQVDNSLGDLLLQRAGVTKLTLGDTLATFSTDLTATSFVKSGGTSTQFLKADGSVSSHSPVITLGGDLSGSVTLTNLGNGTLTATVLDDSHNHIIANVDGLQTALDGKLATTLTSARIFVGNASNIATGVVMSGDVTISNTGVTSISSNSITNARLRDSVAYSVIGRSSSTSGDPADIVAGTDGHVLRRSGTTLGFGTIGNASISDLAFSKLTGLPSPVITLGGDLSGSVTLTSLGNGTLTATVLDDSHNHIIANVDGLQTALDSKANSSALSSYVLKAGDTMTGALTISNGQLTLSNGGITASSDIKGNALRATGDINTAGLTGNGVEIVYNNINGWGRVLSYDRTSGSTTYRPLRFEGSSFTFTTAGDANIQATLDGTAFNVFRNTNINGNLSIKSESDHLTLDSVGATISPIIRFNQAGVLKGYVDYRNSTQRMRLQGVAGINVEIGANGGTQVIISPTSITQSVDTYINGNLDITGALSIGSGTGTLISENSISNVNSISYGSLTVSSTTTISTTSLRDILKIATDSAITVTLPPVSENLGRVIKIYGWSTTIVTSNNITIEGNGSERFYYGNGASGTPENGYLSIKICSGRKEAVVILGTSDGWIVLSATASPYGDIDA